MLCVNYLKPDMDCIEEARQIRVKYNPSDDTLIEFINRNPNKHIYLDAADVYLYSDREAVNYLRGLKDKAGDNWTLITRFTDVIKSQDKDSINTKIKALKDCCHTYCFSEIISSWEELDYMVNCIGVNEIYVGGFLGFNLPAVKKICDRKGTKVRAFANYCGKPWYDDDTARGFYIRPEDVDLYSEYLNGIEFFGGAEAQEVMFKVYSEKKWVGNLNEIIIGFNEEFNNQALPGDFGKHRLDCKKRCVTGSGCTLCGTMTYFAKKLENAAQRLNEIENK